MESFQLLSKGGTKFNKKRFERDVKLFNSAKIVNKGKTPETGPDELPPELDFFRYAQGGPGVKRKASLHGEANIGQQTAEKEEHEGETSTAKRPRLEDIPTTKKTLRQKVTSKGKNVPDPLSSFRELRERYKCSSLILSNLEKNGWIDPTGIQAHGIPMLIESRDIAAISPTGTGKTLAYLLPIFALLRTPISASSSSSADNDKGRGVRALVLAPTRELAQQIHNECLKIAQGRKWRITLFSKATAATLADKTVRDKIDIIVSTPLRLVSSLQEDTLELNNVRHLVLDEADRLLDAEFLSQVQEVVESCTHPFLQKAIFSATLPAGAEQIAMRMLKDPIRVVVGLKDTPLPLIRQSLVYVADEASKLPSLVQYLTSTTPGPLTTEHSTAPLPWEPPILIFASTQPRAASLCAQLILHGIQNVDVLHASLTNKQRKDAVHRMLMGECWVLVCTEVAARGMDFKGVRGVINYDWPQSVQSYVHRIGRTGRAGREGTAITYWTDDDAPFLKSIANVLLQSGSSVPEWMLKLPKPSRLKKRQMGRVKRGDEVDTSGRIGRAEAIKKRDMVLASKRKKLKMEMEIDKMRKAEDLDEKWTGFGDIEP